MADRTLILTVTPNPCVDKTVFVPTLEVGTFMRSERYTCVAGGKGNNVARAVKQLGREACAMPVVGGHPGAHVVDMIRNDDGIRCKPVYVASPTRTVTTILEESTHRQTVFFEPGPAITEDEFKRLLHEFKSTVPEAGVVALCGTVPDRAVERLYRALIPIAKKHDTITILDTYGPELILGLEAKPYMVKPNVAEAKAWAGFALDTDEAKWKAIEKFHAAGVELVVLSLGKDGALVSRGTERLHVTPPAIKEVNSVGSGDALVAGFAIGLLEGMPLEEMAVLGVAAGAANASTWAIGHFAIEDIEKFTQDVCVERVSTT